MTRRRKLALYALGVAAGWALSHGSGDSPMPPVVAVGTGAESPRLERVVVVNVDPGPAAYAAASWYGPGFYGSGVACTGKPLGLYEMNVAATDAFPCGTKLTIYYGGRSARATVTDRGAFEQYGRTFDLGPGIRAALRFEGVHDVGYRLGWYPQTRRVKLRLCRAVRLAGRDDVVRRCARTWGNHLARRIVP
jgi:hypothetical protein